MPCGDMHQSVTDALVRDYKSVDDLLERNQAFLALKIFYLSEISQFWIWMLESQLLYIIIILEGRGVIMQRCSFWIPTLFKSSNCDDLGCIYFKVIYRLQSFSNRMIRTL